MPLATSLTAANRHLRVEVHALHFFFVQSLPWRSCKIDILPRLSHGREPSLDGKAGDSFCKTAMPGRENVACRVDIAVMHRSTVHAAPLSYSKTCDTFGAAALLSTQNRFGRSTLR